MSKFAAEEHVLPRPAERLPDYAHAKARQTLAEKLTDGFKLPESAAKVIADAVVDPAAVRKSIGDPADPETEKIAVPGGTLLGIRTSVWARRIMPDPRNPRTLPQRRHPFAVVPGSGAEDSKFRPLPEPYSPRGAQHVAQLVVDVESRHHLTWASQLAGAYVLAENDWRESIASQGVMEAVWLVPTTYEHGDGYPAVTAMTTAEGSSRVTAVHDLISVRSADVPYEENDAKLRAHLRKLNETFDRGPSGEQSVALRCERVPALILVAFVPHASGGTSFATAVKSLVALRHVDPPKPWGEGPENESLADEVLDELYRCDLISASVRDYFAGSITKDEARAAHLSEDPAVRAAHIVRKLTSTDLRVSQAVRKAVTSQSTRRRITSKLFNELATALILRAVADEPAKTDQVRRYMRYAFGKAVHRVPWESTDRDVDSLAAEALREVRRSIADGSLEDPGPASMELAVRAAYSLVVSGRLNADRGSANNDQPDRRTPGEVLDAMRRTVQGVYQLAQALRDFAEGRQIRAVDENGATRKLNDGISDLTVNDVYLRSEFPPPGKARAPRPGDTPVDRYHNRVEFFSKAVEELGQSFAGIEEAIGDDGRPLVDARGIDARRCAAWRDVLRRIDEELVVWGRTFRRAYGTDSRPATLNAEAGERIETDPFEETGEDLSTWDSAQRHDESNVST
jgi:hypothetical protein